MGTSLPGEVRSRAVRRDGGGGRDCSTRREEGVAPSVFRGDAPDAVHETTYHASIVPPLAPWIGFVPRNVAGTRKISWIRSPSSSRWRSEPTPPGPRAPLSWPFGAIRLCRCLRNHPRRNERSSHVCPPFCFPAKFRGRTGNPRRTDRDLP